MEVQSCHSTPDSVLRCEGLALWEQLVRELEEQQMAVACIRRDIHGELGGALTAALGAGLSIGLSDICGIAGAGIGASGAIAVGAVVVCGSLVSIATGSNPFWAMLRM